MSDVTAILVGFAEAIKERMPPWVWKHCECVHSPHWMSPSKLSVRVATDTRIRLLNLSIEDDMVAIFDFTSDKMQLVQFDLFDPTVVDQVCDVVAKRLLRWAGRKYLIGGDFGRVKLGLEHHVYEKWGWGVEKKDRRRRYLRDAW